MTSLTFVTTCFNRSFQLVQVYYENLLLYENNPHVDFVLVNFHGHDHKEIDDFIFDKCIRFLVTKKLKYFKRKEEMTEFHMARCKNVAHLLSTGEMIYNLDGDNILDGTEYDTVTFNYAQYGSNFILHQCDGPSPMKHDMFRYLKLFPEYHTEHLMFNGTCGRICTSRKLFKEIGGYNERFQFMGMDDIDFLARCIRGTGCSYIHQSLSKNGKFLPNQRQDVYEQTNSKNWETLNHRFFSNLFVNDVFTESIPDNFQQIFPPPQHKRLFDLTFTKQGFGSHHRHGWNEVRDFLVENYENNENGIILDLFCERTYFWNPLDFPESYYHRKAWVGFIHTTMNKNPLYSTLQDLLELDTFLASLKYCYGLFVLSPKNKVVLDSFFLEKGILNENGDRIQVSILRHPTASMETENQLFNPNSLSVTDCPIYHIGWHLRDFSKFYQLECGDRHSKHLIVPDIYPGTFVDSYVKKSCEMTQMEITNPSKVEIMGPLDNEAYDTLLQTSIIFNYLIEPSGSNLITECISRTNPIIVNRHESLEFYLGKEYPMFYDTLEDVGKLLTEENIRKAVKHLNTLKTKYSYAYFTESFQIKVKKMFFTE